MNSELEKLKYANYIQYSDIDPYEVIKIHTDRKLTIRPMKCTQINKNEFIPGGFASHCVNQESQQWKIESNPEAILTVVIRLGKKGWRCKNGGKFQLSTEPRKYYDFNF